MDSGASKSFVNDLRYLFNPVQKRVCVNAAADQKMYSTHLGDIYIESDNGQKLKLKALYIKELTKNILSVSDITRSGNFTFVCEKGQGRIEKSSDRTKILSATLKGGLYWVNQRMIRNPNYSASITSQAKSSKASQALSSASKQFLADTSVADNNSEW